MQIKINDNNYDMACTLRVAYNIQGQHNHKAYLEIFQSIDKMTLEEQIKMLYASYKCANSSAPITEKEFMDAVLDNYNLMDVMDMINELVEGITYGGMTVEKREEKKKAMLQMS